jgi:iron complex transport system permease protein
MADPGVIGVSSGAALGAVLALYAGVAALSVFVVPFAAFVGALGAAALVYAVATSRGRTPVTTLLLAGVAVSGIAGALVSFVLSLSLADWEVGRHMLGWLMGSLDGRSWSHVAMSAPVVVGGSLWLATYARDLDALITGEESALAVGVDVPRVKRALLIVSSLVTGATVAVTGIVGFVGLMVPHIVRLVTGPRHGLLVPACFLSGAIFVVWADVACRVAPASDLRLGVVTALTGGPFFLFLLVRHQSRSRG